MRGDRGARATPLFPDQTEAQRAEKNFFLARPTTLPYSHSPPYLKVWIPHCLPATFEASLAILGNITFSSHIRKHQYFAAITYLASSCYGLLIVRNLKIPNRVIFSSRGSGNVLISHRTQNQLGDL